jgi:hypothetical protein
MGDLIALGAMAIWIFGLIIFIWFLFMILKIKQNSDTMVDALILIKKQNDEIISELKKRSHNQAT